MPLTLQLTHSYSYHLLSQTSSLNSVFVSYTQKAQANQCFSTLLIPFYIPNALSSVFTHIISLFLEMLHHKHCYDHYKSSRTFMKVSY